VNKKKSSVYIVALIGFTLSVHGVGFQTLQDMQHYASRMPEYPDIDNTNWLQPDFSSFYSKYTTSWLDSILTFLKFKERPIWSARYFKKVLLELIERREKDGYTGRHIIHITPKPGDRFIIWGDIQGAFHSLVRDLIELERRGIINNNLEIVQPYFSFIFNGNVVDRSPYILETLTVVIQLMKKNPYHVFYIRGMDEDKENWYDFGTKVELQAKAGAVSSEDPPLNTEMKRFFNTLPLALYLIADRKKDSIEVVRITNLVGETDEVDENQVGGFFETLDASRPVIYKLFDRKPTTKKIEIVGVIKGEDRTHHYTQTKGLVRLNFQEGGIAWSLLSSPTSTYRNLYNFFWDAFSLLRVKEYLDDWTISLYSQDVRDLLGFAKAEKFSFRTGFQYKKEQTTEFHQDKVDVLQQKLKGLEKDLEKYSTRCPVIQEDQKKKNGTPESVSIDKVPIQEDKKADVSIRPERIVLGFTGDLEKGIKGYTYSMIAGSKLFFDAVLNDEGGVRGKEVDLVTLNDNYEPDLARQNILRFMNEVGVDIIFNPLGSPTIMQYVDLIKEEKVAVLFPHAGTLAIRDQQIPYVVNFQVSYFKEGQVLAKHAVEKTAARRFVMIYQNDSYGIPPRDGAIKELKKQGIADENILQVPHNRNDANLASQANNLKNFGPDVIFFFTTPAWAKSLIRHLGAGYFAGKKCFAMSSLSAKEFRDFMRYKGLDMIFTAHTPSPEYSTIQLVKEFRQRAKKSNVYIDVPSLEGYIAAELFYYLISRIPKDQPITKKTIINAARTVKDQEYKGLKLDYNEQINGLNSMIWLCTREDSDWQAIDTVVEDL